MKTILSFSAALATFVAVAGASIDNVIVRQQWPWNPKVNIDYVLSDAEQGAHDVKVQLKNGSDEIVCWAGSLSGDLEGVRPGAHRIVWDPTVGRTSDAPLAYADFSVVVSIADDPKKFMVIDLSAGTAQDASYGVSFAAVPPEGGWVQDLYKTTRLVLRHIPAGTFTMGSPETEAPNFRNAVYETQHSVTLTKDFYMAIFPTTAYQYNLITGSAPTGNATGKGYVYFVSYNMLRGDNARTNWPNCDGDSFFGLLNGRVSGLDELPKYRFDLPSSAQWEYACRANTTTTWYNGTDYDPASEEDPNSYEPNLSLLGVYKYNFASYYDGLGKLLPNGWGLYNMLGSACECVRDVIPFANSGVVISSSPVTGTDCVMYTAGGTTWLRGGYGSAKPYACRPSSWSDGNYGKSTGNNFQNGFRVCCTYFE